MGVAAVEEWNCLSANAYGILPEAGADAPRSSRRCNGGRGPLITEDTLTDYIRRTMPDAVVTMIDKTGLIYQALDAPMKDGRIHALELTAKTKEEQHN